MCPIQITTDPVSHLLALSKGCWLPAERTHMKLVFTWQPDISYKVTTWQSFKKLLYLYVSMHFASFMQVIQTLEKHRNISQTLRRLFCVYIFYYCLLYGYQTLYRWKAWWDFVLGGPGAKMLLHNNNYAGILLVSSCVSIYCYTDTLYIAI